jgi:hypothetical protein
LTVSGTVVDHGNFLELESISRIEGQTRAQCQVVGNDAVGGLVAWLCQVGVGRCTGDVRNTAVVVDLGSGNGGARVQVTHNAGHLGIAQFLCNCCALFWISCIIFGRKFELDFLATNGDTLGVQVFNRHPNTVLVVLAVVGLATRHRCHVTNFHDHILRQRHASGGCNGRCNCQFQFHLHRQLQVKKNCESDNSATRTITQFLRHRHRVVTKKHSPGA